METVIQLENHDLIPVTETWWEELQDWSTAIEGYKIFRRGGLGRRCRSLCSKFRKREIVKSCLYKLDRNRFRACG